MEREPWRWGGLISIVSGSFLCKFKILNLAYIILSISTIAGGGCSIVQASDFVYRPVNPSFGGNPFNSAHLLGLADRQNQYKESASSRSGIDSLRSSPADQFVRQLQSRMMSSLARQVNEAVFGDNAAESGRIIFGDQVITFERGLEAVHMVIEDNAAGTRTEISVPVLQVD
ncbi:curli assembly protein CsgF [Halomonas sp. ATCH28]|uniref:Curli production assembly/transport component CsgF n=1 Tax=Halomonas gemina TaxID=2945105 RepID=A0ABT0T7D9_9GAMM|nr:curli assembly protein CsgF [Halomonas gemina]MCL7942305.1 curli assembly protein CsgF [Halomonas gemina]